MLMYQRELRDTQAVLDEMLKQVNSLKEENNALRDPPRDYDLYVFSESVCRHDSLSYSLTHTSIPRTTQAHKLCVSFIYRW